MDIKFLFFGFLFEMKIYIYGEREREVGYEWNCEIGEFDRSYLEEV